MRTKKSLINMAVAIFNTVFTILVGYAVQIIFVRKLGAEYLGISGLFSNIIAILGLVELGVGTAIVFNLYKPVADKDEKRIVTLLNFYKRTYAIIALIVFILGVILIPFIPKIVGEVSIPENLILIYLLMLFEVICSYFLAHKRTLLYVNQENYIVNIVHIFYTILLNSILIFILLNSKNYILYLSVKTIFKLLENIAISIYVNRKYSYINSKEYSPLKLDKETKDEMLKKVKALFTHRLGSYIVNGTDNVLLTKMFSIVTTGLYTNYYYIITSASSLILQFFVSVKASVGNLLVTESREKCYEIYKKLNFFNFWLYSLCAIGFCSVIQPFIEFSYGSQYLFKDIVVYVLTINFFLQGMRQTINVYKEVGGLYYEDRYIPILEATINVVFSIIFGKFIGIAGIFLGTICSQLVIHLYSYPKYVYQKLFGRKRMEYIKILTKQTILFILMLLLVSLINKLYVFNNVYLEFFKNGFVCLIIVNIIYVIIFHKKEEYKYYKDLLKTILKRRKKNKSEKDN